MDETAAPAPQQLAVFKPVYGPLLQKLEGTEGLRLLTGEETHQYEPHIAKLREEARQNRDPLAAEGTVFLALAAVLLQEDSAFERAMLEAAKDAGHPNVKRAWRNRNTFKRSLQNYYFIQRITPKSADSAWLVLRRTVRKDRTRKRQRESASSADDDTPLKTLSARRQKSAAAAAAAAAAALATAASSVTAMARFSPIAPVASPLGAMDGSAFRASGAGRNARVATRSSPVSAAAARAEAAANAAAAAAEAAADAARRAASAALATLKAPEVTYGSLAVGDCAVTWADRGTLRVWTPTHTAELVGHRDRVVGALTLPHERTAERGAGPPPLVTWSWDCTLRVWAPGAGPAEYSASQCRVLTGHTGAVLGATFFGKRAPVLVSWSFDASLRVWLHTGSLRLAGHRAPIGGVVGVPVHGSRCLEGEPAPALVSWSLDRTLRVWAPAGAASDETEPLYSPHRCVVLSGHTALVRGAIALPAQAGALPVLASWADDGAIRLWAPDAAGAYASERCAVLAGHRSGVRVAGVRALGDGMLLSWSLDDSLHVWSCATQTSVALVGHSDAVRGALPVAGSASWPPAIVSWAHDGTLRVWRPAPDGSYPTEQSIALDWSQATAGACVSAEFVDGDACVLVRDAAGLCWALDLRERCVRYAPL